MEEPTVTEERFVAIAARTIVLQEIVEMLLAGEIASQSWTGRHWLDRAALARADLADKRKAITPDPVRAILEEIVRIVERAAELAPAARI
ncbi:hypothetical protein NKJ74_05585 [Mesorhizobium sp. M0046]|uniref:hypothetical protein n=1 Tax=Mesorhizobium sp. M0046 TaxID=2956858 RepID=UPI0033355569